MTNSECSTPLILLKHPCTADKSIGFIGGEPGLALPPVQTYHLMLFSLPSAVYSACHSLSDCHPKDGRVHAQRDGHIEHLSCFGPSGGPYFNALR